MSELDNALAAAKKAVKDLEAAVAEASKPKPVVVCEEDVTGAVKATLLTEGGTIRLALEHKGNVIVRSGAGQALSLTSYAKGAGYRLEMGRKALRGSYFRVIAKGC